MSRLLCCLRVRRARDDMGAALERQQVGDASDRTVCGAPPTMADVIRERKKKAGGAALGTLRRRLAAAARRSRDAGPERGCEHARFLRSVVATWRPAEVVVLGEQLEALAALRDLHAQAALAREPARPLAADLARLRHARLACDVELRGAGFSLPAHRAVLLARCDHFRDLLRRHPASARVPLEGVSASLSRAQLEAVLHALYAGAPPPADHAGSLRNCRGGGGGRHASLAMLDDGFRLYEIARFLEMPIVVQGCEDAIVCALSPDTLPHVLRWCAEPVASQWVQRQAMRYLRDEFPAVMAAPAAAALPRAALADALSSDFLQAGEAQALRALLRWAERAAREPPGAAPRDLLAPLAPLVRTEHLPPDCDVLQQAVRRGVVGAPAPWQGGAAAWLGRGACRPPRCFLPYLDEVKALLESQVVPEAELAAARRSRLLLPIPDALYMLADIPRNRHPRPERRAGMSHTCSC
ncbi:BTB/POZ domain-containing protein 7 [Leptidea sinapis]|uniref:BTB/POZ domain-containing protein 7 n=1 Tax=Leptidea sinapis TaxID=189913 RepID=UPI0021C3D880|nr:BTB/POZ domain-containing protein 7 [Leptidea sinapis]